MTETTSGPARGSRAKGAKASKGLRIERIHTTPGVHPYDEVVWERRDVVMTNWRDGSVNFEQRGVEFPDFWSVNAVNIVTSKYFRGAVGTPQRETEPQAAHRPHREDVPRRPARTTATSPRPPTPRSSSTSWPTPSCTRSSASTRPVWFNVGTPQPQQVSACFILSVDDSMESILDWYKEEGMIFKGGSGAGLNLSRIRSSKELLSSGGNASGPVSFMRGADASAGTIKSGGATRRAAKMVVLDVDHPDVEDFIETKVKEEEKIRALRDAGFDMDLGGDDITSVQYQNANNSVRVNDEFMKAVEAGAQVRAARPDDRRGHRGGRRQGALPQDGRGRLGLRRPGHPVRRHDQPLAHLARSPAGSPRSNPCSEYMHLDNSSCNLASLNLMKFLQATTARATSPSTPSASPRSSSWSSPRWTSPSASPTSRPQKIGENTRAFRQLGIGYANLGALLMATGHAYDSDGGRALAGAITSLMTGTSYRRSAELAAVVGPYDGYARNADAAQARHEAARRRQRHRRAHGRPGHPGVGRGHRGLAGRAAPRREERLPQRPGVGARPDRHHRPDDGLRHHRRRARPGPGQVQEAGRRRLDADREQHGPAGAAAAWATRRSRSRRSSPTSPSTAT